jgi:5'-nucleotidase
MEQPLILVTNDDGIQSDGLWAAAEAVLPLGEVIVVAPDRQWSGGGRSMPPDSTGRIVPCIRSVNGQPVKGYAVDASPALAVQHGVLELAPRRPSLVVSGINFGLNLAVDVTISGTVGAALEASALGIPALAVSLEMDPVYHLTGDKSASYVPAMAFTERLALRLLSSGLPYGADVLSVNIPSSATADTPWHVTRLSRCRFFEPVAPDRARGEGRPRYRELPDPTEAELGSDVWAVKVQRVVSVTPLSLDLTARVDPDELAEDLKTEPTELPHLLDSWVSAYLLVG